MKLRPLLLSLLLAVTLTACAPREPDLLRLFQSVEHSCTELSDTHGGIQGDGLSYRMYSYADGLDEILRSLPQWKPLPMDRTATILAYGIQTDTAEDGPYLADEKGQPLLPPIETGWYCLVDRQTGDHHPILERYSFNLTLAVYDSSTKCLHLIEFDT